MNLKLRKFLSDGAKAVTRLPDLVNKPSGHTTLFYFGRKKVATNVLTSADRRGINMVLRTSNQHRLYVILMLIP